MARKAPSPFDGSQPPNGAKTSGIHLQPSKTNIPNFVASSQHIVRRLLQGKAIWAQT
jgi:hypothetical protein